jgi:asparagine synthase (glutamine-hydrolysing)
MSDSFAPYNSSEMCGINGLLLPNGSKLNHREIVATMNRTLSHRGPDNDGIWEQGSVCFGHRRLSIIDLSPECNQPFFSSDGRYVIVYNGELYNYRELKLELQRNAKGENGKPYFFKTNSDTEVVIAAFIRWGAKCLDLFNGMYAFAICDKETGRLFIARDRLGVKPLYYHYGDEGFIFSSEMRPIIRSGLKNFVLNGEKVGEYVMYQTVFAPHTIVKGIKTLMPGHFIDIENGIPTIKKYYELNHLNTDNTEVGYKETCVKVRELLAHSVQQRLIADVPFGAFLSGGIDSSIIVGLMSAVSTERVRTFNVSFDEGEFSESQYARMVAKKFNAVHEEIRLSPGDFLKQLPESLSSMDHPSGDGPNTYVVSKATKNAGITMALSGIGGDELFAGYSVFTRMAKLGKKDWITSAPRAIRALGGELLSLTGKSATTKKLGELISQGVINFESAYPLSRSLFTENELRRIVADEESKKTMNGILAHIPQIEEHLLSAVSLAEIQTYLQNVLLRDTDQMGMSVALEIREPFLDYKLVEFVLAVKDEFKFPHTPKKLLVDSMAGLIPDEVVNRPKMGFTLPWQHWLKNQLRSFCEQNLIEISTSGLFVNDAPLTLWEKFLAGDKSITWSRVWHLVILNNWMKENKIFPAA